MKTYTVTEFWELLERLTERFETASERDTFDTTFVEARTYAENNWTSEERAELDRLMEVENQEVLDSFKRNAAIAEEVEKISATMPLVESILNIDDIYAQAAQNLNIDLDDFY